MLIIVFAVAVARVNVGAVIVLLLIQICAGAWYSISYIPFARKIVIEFCRNTCCKPCCDAYDTMKQSASSQGNNTSSNKGGDGGNSSVSFSKISGSAQI